LARWESTHRTLKSFFGYASSLEEFGGGPYDEDLKNYFAVSLPTNISRLSLTNILNEEFVFPNAAKLIKLELSDAKLDMAGS
jgi:hypothetical protein